jgi:hypothetical protein
MTIVKQTPFHFGRIAQSKTQVTTFGNFFSSRGSGTHRYQFPRRKAAARDCPATDADQEPSAQVGDSAYQPSTFSYPTFSITSAAFRSSSSA